MGDVDDLDSLLDNNVFDEDVLSSRGNFLDDSDDIPDVSQRYDRPTRGDLLSIEAVAKVAPSESSRGVQRRGGSETTVLDVSGELNDDGYTELGGSVGGDTITLPSESSGLDAGGGTTVDSLDTETVADRLAAVTNQRRAEESGYVPELERTHGMDKAAQEHADRMENNIDEGEEVNSVRSGAVPATTRDRSRKQRYVRNAATACHTGGGANSIYTKGSYVALTDEVEGIIERRGTSTTTVNAEGMAPVTVPNYALPLYETYVYDSWKAGGEINEAYVYSDLVNGTASSAEVADALTDRLTDAPEFSDTALESSYRSQGVGVSFDDDTGVIYVTQSFC
jgi:uncharacterized protein YkwD